MGASASLPARREFISRDYSRQHDGRKTNGRGTTNISRRLRNIDVAANIVRHITQVSCDAYFNEIMSHVTQTDPVPAPGDEHVAPVLSEVSHEQVQQQIVVADFLEPPVPVIESFTPAPAVTYTAPAPAIKHVSFAPDDPARIDCVAPAHVIESTGSITVVETFASLVVGSRPPLDEFATPVHQEQIAVEQIVHPQIQEQIVEGVMEIPQERLPEEIEEQIDDVLVPQSACYISPTPVIQDVTPAPSILYPAPKADYATQSSVIGVHRISTTSDRFIAQSTVASCIHRDSRRHWCEPKHHRRGEPAMCYHSCGGSSPTGCGISSSLG